MPVYSKFERYVIDGLLEKAARLVNPKGDGILRTKPEWEKLSAFYFDGSLDKLTVGYLFDYNQEEYYSKKKYSHTSDGEKKRYRYHSVTPKTLSILSEIVTEGKVSSWEDYLKFETERIIDSLQHSGARNPLKKDYLYKYLDGLVSRFTVVKIPGSSVQFEIENALIRPLVGSLPQNPGNQNQSTTNETPKELLGDLLERKPFVWITGGAGEGKSTMLKLTSYKLAKHLLDSESEIQEYFPIFLDLKWLGKEKIKEKLFSHFQSYAPKLSRAELWSSLNELVPIFFFDSFDEISDEEKQSVSIQIEEIRATSPFLKLVIASRTPLPSFLFKDINFFEFSPPQIDRKDLRKIASLYLPIPKAIALVQKVTSRGVIPELKNPLIFSLLISKLLSHGSKKIEELNPVIRSKAKLYKEILLHDFLKGYENERDKLPDTFENVIDLLEKTACYLIASKSTFISKDGLFNISEKFKLSISDSSEAKRLHSFFNSSSIFEVFEDKVSFKHNSFKEFCGGLWLLSQNYSTEEIYRTYFEHPEWKESIDFMVGLIPDPNKFILELLNFEKNYRRLAPVLPQLIFRAFKFKAPYVPFLRLALASHCIGQNESISGKVAEMLIREMERFYKIKVLDYSSGELNVRRDWNLRKGLVAEFYDPNQSQKNNYSEGFGIFYLLSEMNHPLGTQALIASVYEKHPVFSTRNLPVNHPLKALCETNGNPETMECVLAQYYETSAFVLPEMDDFLIRNLNPRIIEFFLSRLRNVHLDNRVRVGVVFFFRKMSETRLVIEEPLFDFLVEEVFMIIDEFPEGEIASAGIEILLHACVGRRIINEEHLHDVSKSHIKSIIIENKENIVESKVFDHFVSYFFEKRDLANYVFARLILFLANWDFQDHELKAKCIALALKLHSVEKDNWRIINACVTFIINQSNWLEPEHFMWLVNVLESDYHENRKTSGDDTYLSFAKSKIALLFYQNRKPGVLEYCIRNAELGKTFFKKELWGLLLEIDFFRFIDNPSRVRSEVWYIREIEGMLIQIEEKKVVPKTAPMFYSKLSVLIDDLGWIGSKDAVPTLRNVREKLDGSRSENFREAIQRALKAEEKIRNRIISALKE